MALTAATGPFSGKSPGTFNLEIETPTGAVIFWDPVPQRIRGVVAGETVVDSTNAKLLHETGHLPVYYFPDEDVRADLLVDSDTRTICPHKGEARYHSLLVGDRTVADAVWYYPEPIENAPFLVGHKAFYWRLVGEWYAEDEQLFGHPRDPYARIDVYPTSRRIRVSLDGELLADTVRAKALFESNLPTRWYLPQDDVRLELLEPSSTLTRCAYKGQASYWHVRIGDELHEDLAWTYHEPQHDAEPARDLIAFYNERVDIEVDGQPHERPMTQWSR
ncbi:MAG TPA: DUF427 domain-containing protein [Gaiellaceae bacterium]|nr:DUF427 domain-containing protein [Gaiellaceae bacterium]